MAESMSSDWSDGVQLRNLVFMRVFLSMRVFVRSLRVLVAGALAGHALACSGAVTEPPPAPAGGNATTPATPGTSVPEPGTATASFRRDVVPLFNASCAFAGCHGPDSYVQPTLGPDLSRTGSPSYPTPDEV